MNFAVVMMFVLPVCKKATARCKLFCALKMRIQGGKSNSGNTSTMSELCFYNAFVHIYLCKLTPFDSKAFTQRKIASTASGTNNN